MPTTGRNQPIRERPGCCKAVHARVVLALNLRGAERSSHIQRKEREKASPSVTIISVLYMKIEEEFVPLALDTYGHKRFIHSDLLARF